MKKTIVAVRLIAVSMLISLGVSAQNLNINVSGQQDGITDSEWPLDAKNTTILVNVCNLDGGTLGVQPYKIRPLISIPNELVTIENVDLPTGWTILSNNGADIRFSNGTDLIGAGECRDIVIHVKPTAKGGPLSVTSIISYSNGVAPGNVFGAQTPGNDPADDNSTTFILVGSPLPVTLISFTAARENKTALLNWATTSETNSDRFEIQHSLTGKDWNKIGVITSNGESSAKIDYSFTDKNVAQGENLYRLKMIDKDATFAYSRIQSITFDGITSEAVSIYPNPSTDRVFVQDMDLSQVKQVSIMDMNGRAVFSSNSLTSNGISVSKFIAGTYVLHIANINGSVSNHKIVIAK